MMNNSWETWVADAAAEQTIGAQADCKVAEVCMSQGLIGWYRFAPLACPRKQTCRQVVDLQWFSGAVPVVIFRAR